MIMLLEIKKDRQQDREELVRKMDKNRQNERKH